VFAGLDGFLELHGAKSRRRSEDDDIGFGDGLFVTVEAEKLALRRDVHGVTVRGLEIVERSLQSILVDVGNGDEFDGAEIDGVERLADRSRSATADSNCGDLESVIAGRPEGEALDGENGSGGKGAGPFKETAPG
jgi:hypothetical protein